MDSSGNNLSEKVELWTSKQWNLLLSNKIESIFIYFNCIKNVWNKLCTL